MRYHYIDHYSREIDIFLRDETFVEGGETILVSNKKCSKINCSLLIRFLPLWRHSNHSIASFRARLSQFFASLLPHSFSFPWVNTIDGYIEWKTVGTDSSTTSTIPAAFTAATTTNGRSILIVASIECWYECDNIKHLLFLLLGRRLTNVHRCTKSSSNYSHAKVDTWITRHRSKLLPITGSIGETLPDAIITKWLSYRNGL